MPCQQFSILQTNAYLPYGLAPFRLETNCLLRFVSRSESLDQSQANTAFSGALYYRNRFIALMSLRTSLPVLHPPLCSVLAAACETRRCNQLLLHGQLLHQNNIALHIQIVTDFWPAAGGTSAVAAMLLPLHVNNPILLLLQLPLLLVASSAVLLPCSSSPPPPAASSNALHPSCPPLPPSASAAAVHPLLYLTCMFHDIIVQVVDLEHPHDCRAPHVRVAVIQTLMHRGHLGEGPGAAGERCGYRDECRSTSPVYEVERSRQAISLGGHWHQHLEVHRMLDLCFRLHIYRLHKAIMVQRCQGSFASSRGHQ